jgi:hypothetical protein
MFGLEEQNQQDLRSIHYHTSSPIGDPLYNRYTAGPQAREFFYSLSGIPFALVDGTEPLNLTNTSANQSLIDKEALEDPLFNLAISCYNNNGISIEVEATAQQTFSNLDLVFHCAIVEKELEISAPSGETSFYNVLKEFLPDPGGSVMPGFMDEGDIYSSSYTWTPSSSSVLSQTRVVTFVQNINTRQIYQSGYYDLSNITSNHPIELSSSILIYPNPSSDIIWIESPVIIDQIRVYDLTGRLLSIQKPNSEKFYIPLNDLNSGVYLVNLKTSKGEVVKKVIKQ